MTRNQRESFRVRRCDYYSNREETFETEFEIFLTKIVGRPSCISNGDSSLRFCILHRDVFSIEEPNRGVEEQYNCEINYS